MGFCISYFEYFGVFCPGLRRIYKYSLTLRAREPTGLLVVYIFLDISYSLTRLAIAHSLIFAGQHKETQYSVRGKLASSYGYVSERPQQHLQKRVSERDVEARSPADLRLGKGGRRQRSRRGHRATRLRQRTGRFGKVLRLAIQSYTGSKGKTISVPSRQIPAVAPSQCITFRHPGDVEKRPGFHHP